MSISRKRLTAVLAAGAAAAVLLVGCSSQTAPASRGDSANVAPVHGGDLVYVATADISSFFWSLTNSWDSGIIFGQVVDRLIYWQAGDDILRPWLAESWEVNDDSTEFTFNIRQGVTFSDGTPLDAEVVANNLTLKGLGDVERGLIAVPTFPPGFVSAEALDASTVLVTFDRPAFGFLRSLTFIHSGIVGQSTLDLDIDGAARIEQIVGTGPFTFTSYSPGEQYVLTKRDDYDWAPDGVSHQGPAYIDTLTVKIASEPNIRVGLLESGQAHLVRDVPPADETRLTAAGLSVLPAQQTATSIHLRVRPNSDATKDVRVRQALQIGLDREELVSTLYYTDLWSPATSILNDSVPGAIDLSDQLEYDLDGATALLDAAGWTEIDDEGYRVKNGQRISLTIYPVVYIQNSEAELLQIAQQYKTLGVEVLVKKVDPSQSNAAIAAADVSAQITLGSVPQVTGPIYNGFHSQVPDSWFSSGGENVDTTLDALLETLSSVGNEEAYNAAIADVQRYLIEQAYVIPLEINLLTFGADPAAVEGITFDAYGRPFFYDASLVAP